MGSIPTRSRHPGRATVVVSLAVLTFIAARTCPARAQQSDSVPAAGKPSAAGVAVRGDTTPADTTSGRRGAGSPISPLGAFARSLVVPGWGQASVGKPVRGAFYFVAEAASVFMAIKSQEKLSAARAALAAGQADQSLVDSRVSQREDWIVLSAFWALMSGVDAWVSANLADFQQPLTPPPDGSPGAALRVRVPLGGP